MLQNLLLPIIASLLLLLASHNDLGAVVRAQNAANYSYDIQAGPTACYQCIPGTFAAAIESQTCTLCDEGFFSSANASGACTQCPPGLTSWRGAAECKIGLGATQCYACDAGTFSAPESATCTKCGAGSYVNGTGSGNCTQCPEGTYSNSTQQATTNCTLCPTGYYADTKGNVACTMCPAGTYSAQSGSSTCTACAAGSYVSAPGSTACLLCPAGTSTNSTPLI